MIGRLSALYHEFSKKTLLSLGIPRDHHAWPREWVEIYFKTYPRFPQYKLPSPVALDTALQEALQKRAAGRNYKNTVPVPPDILSTLLFYAAGVRDGSDAKRRFYPSGGARYPLEVYIATRGDKALSAGLYHYRIQDHSLEVLGGEELATRVAKSLTYEFAQEAPTIIVVTAIWERNFVKYKDFGYPVVLLEAGHMGQNFALLATALGLNSCPIAGFRLDDLSDTLGLDPVIEAPVHVIVLGKV